jgi:hypothetical protein
MTQALRDDTDAQTTLYTRRGQARLTSSNHPGSITPAPLTAAAPISFLTEGSPDREPRDLVASFLDRTLDLLLFLPPSLE